MNSVHEPGSRTMSKDRLRNNTESIQIENRPSAPSAQPVASLRAQAAHPTPRPRAPRAQAARAPRLPAARSPSASCSPPAAPRAPASAACLCLRPALARAPLHKLHHVFFYANLVNSLNHLLLSLISRVLTP